MELSLTLFLSCALLAVCGLLLLRIARALLAGQRRRVDWRHTLLLASLLAATGIVVVTEALSLLARFQREWVLAAWVALTAAAALVRLRLLSKPERGLGTRLQTQGLRLSALEMVMLATAALYACALAVVALSYPPNNYDSMTYHLARIQHWAQSRSVGFYPTGVMMQVRGAPFAEYAIAHLEFLAGGDRLANLVQWYAMALSAIGGSAIVAELGGSRVRQIGCALFVVSIPMGILQATSTQNDYVEAAWMVCFAVFSLRFALEPSSWLCVVAIGLSLGLAILTKQTALAYAVGFCIFVGIVALARLRWRAVAAGATMCAIVLVINAGFVFRTLHLYGSVLGPSAGLTNELRSVSGLTSTAIRNLAVNLTSSTGIRSVDSSAASLMAVLRAVHSLTGLSPTDPRTTLTISEDPFATAARMHEDLAGNWVHTALSLLAVAACAFWLARYWRDSRSREGVLLVAGYAACVLLGALFFCYQFKWQVWGTRLQLSLFVLACPLLATTLLRGSDRLLAVLALAVAALGFPWVAGNVTRPLDWAVLSGRVDRTAWYFANRPDLTPVFRALTDAIATTPCRRIGLRISTDPFEYPLWVLLGQRNVHATLEYVEAHPYVPIPPDPHFYPCAVISAGAEPRWSAVPARQFSGFFLYDLSSYTP